MIAINFQGNNQPWKRETHFDNFCKNSSHFLWEKVDRSFIESSMSPSTLLVQEFPFIKAAIVVSSDPVYGKICIHVFYVNMILLKLGESLGGGGEEDPPASWHPLYANLWPHQKRNRIESRSRLRNAHSKLVLKCKKITKTTVLNEMEPFFFFEIPNALIWILWFQIMCQSSNPPEKPKNNCLNLLG